jgi:L-fuconolactonase
VIVDAHHHFWRYDPVQYGWIGDSMARLRRDFLPEDLAKEIAAAGVDAVVSVQARQIVEETEQLLKYAEGNAFIAGVVGWAPLVDPGIEKDLERFAARPKLKAMRHVLQDEDASYMLRDDFNRGVAALARHGLAYDVLIYERQLPQAIEFVDRHPGHRFILDHIAKPRIREGILEPWRANLRRLAERPNVWCKVSGMVTEADFKAWTEAQLQPYLEATLEAFGPRRLMLGSDWPVCLAACEYGRWVSIVRRFAGRLSKAEQERILGGTAAEAYRL